jgi:NADH-quinone oxidoreductase subunit C
MKQLTALLTRIQTDWSSVKGQLSDCQELTVEVSASDWLAFARYARDELHFEQLIDLCGVDYVAYGQTNWETDNAPNAGFSRGVFDFESSVADTQLSMPNRFAVVTHLLSVQDNLRLRVKVFCDNTDFPMVDSVCEIWTVANWFEREAFDLFGIAFQNHPDLRRLLTDYGFVGYPLRKDFPLEGQVEMRFDDQLNRVVYEPVSITNRVNVPRVLRPTERLGAE